MNVTEALRKQFRTIKRARGQSAGGQLGKRARRMLAKAKARELRPFSMQEIVQAAIVNRRRAAGLNAAQQFYQTLIAGKFGGPGSHTKRTVASAA